MNFIPILLSILFLTVPIEFAEAIPLPDKVNLAGTIETVDPSDPASRILSVSTQGQVKLPADRIQFNINLNAEAESPQDAYELHKKREDVLVELLKNFNINEEDINYEPVSISKINRHRPEEKERTYQTMQSVRIMISDFSKYEHIQVRLIESGYDNFSGAFMSSKAKEGKNMAIQEAIKKAREKAEVIAKEAGLALGKIKMIDYREYPDNPQYARASMAVASESDLMEFNQTVTISASVNIDYELEERR